MDRNQIIQRLIADVAEAKPDLKRTPEPNGVTDSAESVLDYNQIMNTNMTVNYTVGLDFVHRIREEFTADSKREALDLCSGPGHYTICLAEYLGYRKVTGIDFSGPMIDIAKKNAKGINATIEFRKCDALQLENAGFATGRFDLVRFANASHHFSRIENVREILRVSETLCRPDGTIILTDLCRLPTANVTSRFVEFAGQDYIEQKMFAMYDDFMNSMFAAWSSEELSYAVPHSSKRVWFQIVSAVLPYYQVLVGLPIGRENLFARESGDWEQVGIFRSENSKLDWETTKTMYYTGVSRKISRLDRKLKIA